MTKPLPSRPDPSLTERTPQGREERGPSLADFQRTARLVERLGEALDPILGPDMYVEARPYADSWVELTVSALIGPEGRAWPDMNGRRCSLRVRGIPGDPNPFPRFRLFRWFR